MKKQIVKALRHRKYSSDVGTMIVCLLPRSEEFMIAVEMTDKQGGRDVEYLPTCATNGKQAIMRFGKFVDALESSGTLLESVGLCEQWIDAAFIKVN